MMDILQLSGCEYEKQLSLTNYELLRNIKKEFYKEKNNY